MQLDIYNRVIDYKKSLIVSMGGQTILEIPKDIIAIFFPSLTSRVGCVRFSCFNRIQETWFKPTPALKYGRI